MGQHSAPVACDLCYFNAFVSYTYILPCVSQNDPVLEVVPKGVQWYTQEGDNMEEEQEEEQEQAIIQESSLAKSDGSWCTQINTKNTLCIPRITPCRMWVEPDA